MAGAMGNVHASPQSVISGVEDVIRLVVRLQVDIGRGAIVGGAEDAEAKLQIELSRCFIALRRTAVASPVEEWVKAHDHHARKSTHSILKAPRVGLRCSVLLLGTWRHAYYAIVVVDVFRIDFVLGV
jgi:hypothetical protein